MNNMNHWTSGSLDNFVFQISSDFIGQIETQMERSKKTYLALAEDLGVSPSRVSQVLNNPGNLTIGSTVRYARALGLKVALVAYDDHDPGNNRGPINAEVFTRCWEALNTPCDLSFLDLPKLQFSGEFKAQSQFYRPIVHVLPNMVQVHKGEKNNLIVAQGVKQTNYTVGKVATKRGRAA